MWCTACATAIAASAKPVAISLSLPVEGRDVAARPHAVEVRLHHAVDHERVLGELESPLLQRAELRGEAELQEDVIAFQPLDAAVLDVVELDGLDRAVALDAADDVRTRSRTRPASTCSITSATVASCAR
jgi:hypothetical protein